MNRPLQRMSRIASLLVWAMFACRALTPLGYMPASFDEGGPYILCAGGWQAELVQYLDTRRGNQHHGKHQHHGQGASYHDQHAAGAECPIGAGFVAALPVTLQLEVALPPPAAPAAEPTTTPTISAPYDRYHSRAPPARRSA